MQGKVDLIQCAGGYQIEIQLPETQILYSTIYHNEQAARRAAKSIAVRLNNLNLVWSEAAKAAGDD